ncbi:hypothetical protein ACTXI9_01470 [Brachybacterium alimentarium]|uniref:hypothetical protein n=1 Tax=Brachybacterium alimentarium TaxID=47845 RepID=UPI003FD31536
MTYSDMTTDELRAAIAEMQAVLEARSIESAKREAVETAVQAYADSQGMTVLEAWRELVPEGVEVPDDPEPEPLPDAPEWVAPTGVHDAYSKGDLVTYRGKVYRSRINGNTWSPAAYPQGWEEYR